ncbi:MAG: RNase J family beta-CASP ribonuclease [Euryarchaeota archaeon]|nr:RNase J family beta-CASP ribonuclease [Euryarchaeota archaeon]
MPSTDEIRIYPVGGYSEYGRNMTAVEVDDEIVIFDMGIKLDRVMIDEDLVFEDTDLLDLVGIGAIPDDSVLESKRDRVVAIVPSHGHLDHIGALPKLAHRYDCPIICTPYTARLVEAYMAKEKAHMATKDVEIIPLPTGQMRPLTRKLTLELVRMTHSILDSSMPVLHTPYGEVVYGNDFKLDNNPVIGRPPDYARLKEIGAGKGESGRGVAALIAETTRAGEDTKTESESVARAILKDHIMGLENDEDGMIVTTFSSHTERIKSIVEFGQKIGREVILLGRSMENYNLLAEEMGFADFMEDVQVWGRRRSIERALGDVMREGKEKYLICATGHQGEPDALLSRIARDETPFQLSRGDHVIFSSNVIPHPVNVANFHVLTHRLRRHSVRMIKGAHVSGHGAREDHYELLQMLRPEHILPSHGDIKAQAAYIGIAQDFGYAPEDNVHITSNGRAVTLKV